jgi:hypothetical protein
MTPDLNLFAGVYANLDTITITFDKDTDKAGLAEGVVQTRETVDALFAFSQSLGFFLLPTSHDRHLASLQAVSADESFLTASCLLLSLRACLHMLHALFSSRCQLPWNMGDLQGVRHHNSRLAGVSTAASGSTRCGPCLAYPPSRRVQRDPPWSLAPATKIKSWLAPAEPRARAPQGRVRLGRCTFALVLRELPKLGAPTQRRTIHTNINFVLEVT